MIYHAPSFCHFLLRSPVEFQQLSLTAVPLPSLFFLKNTREYKGLRIRLKSTNEDNYLLQRELHLVGGPHIVMARLFFSWLPSTPTFLSPHPSWTPQVVAGRDSLCCVQGNSALWSHPHVCSRLRRSLYKAFFFFFLYKKGEPSSWHREGFWLLLQWQWTKSEMEGGIMKTKVIHKKIKSLRNTIWS